MTILHTHFLWCYPDYITGFSHLLDCILVHKELWLCRLIKIIISIKSKQAKDDFWQTREKRVWNYSPYSQNKPDGDYYWFQLNLKLVTPFPSTHLVPLFPLNVTVITSPETFKKLEEYSVGIVAFHTVSVLALHCRCIRGPGYLQYVWLYLSVCVICHTKAITTGSRCYSNIPVLNYSKVVL